MALPAQFVEAISVAAEKASGPLVMPWPMPGALGGFVSFGTFSEWLDFVEALGLGDHVPQIVTAKYLRAQKLLLLSWIDFDLVKAAELVALTALELALHDRYAPRAKATYGKVNLAHLLRYIPEHDGLTDDKVAMNRRCRGGTVIGLLTGERTPSLADIRNDGAHGYPFDGFPQSGLIELVRDLIEYAYRDMRSELA
jgi:hypothetical protein